MSARAERRQHLRAVEKTRARRARGELSNGTKARIAAVKITPITDAADQAFVVNQKRVNAERRGLPSIAWTAGAVYFVARHSLTDERIGCMAVSTMPPSGKALVEDFFVVDGRGGRLAALAMIEALRGLHAHKIAFVAVDNPRMLRVLERYGMRVTGYMVEG